MEITDNLVDEVVISMMVRRLIPLLGYERERVSADQFATTLLFFSTARCFRGLTDSQNDDRRHGIYT